MAACETHALLSAEKEGGRLDRGQSGVLARVLGRAVVATSYVQQDS
jgi:hypothetical protein